MQEKRILILGSSGYLGKNFSKFFKNKYLIFNSHILKKRKVDILKKKYLFNYLSKNKINIILNLSGQLLKNFNEYKKISIEGNKNLISYAKKNNLLNIYFSSDQVYGRSRKKPYNEKSKIAPINEYAKIKYLCEKLYNKSQTKYIIIRLSNVYDTKFKKRGFLNNLKSYFKKKKKTINLNKKNLIRNFIHIEDVCCLINHIIKSNYRNNQIFNISHENLRLEEIINMFEQQFKKKVNLKIKKKEYIQDKIYIDNSLIKKKFNHKFSYNIKKCLKKN